MFSIENILNLFVPEDYARFLHPIAPRVPRGTGNGRLVAIDRRRAAKVRAKRRAKKLGHA